MSRLLALLALWLVVACNPSHVRGFSLGGSGLMAPLGLGGIKQGASSTAGPTVTGVSASSGPARGQTAVTVTGTGFTGASAVTFGAVNAASFSVTNSTTISATTPAGTAAGAVNVSVTVSGNTGTLINGYTYTWDPSILSGLVLWLRGDLGITTGTGVSAWADQSPNGNNFAQATASKQPTTGTSINSQATVNFSGSQALSASTFATDGNKSVIMVFALASTPGSSTIYSGLTLKSATPKFSELLWINTSGYEPYSYRADINASGNAVGIATALNTSAHGQIWTYNGGTNTSTSSYTELLDNSVGTVAASSTVNRATTDLCSLGGRLSSADVVADGSKVNIGEVIVTNTVLAAGDESNLHTYLNTRYGSGVGLLEGTGESKYAANDNGERGRVAN